MRESIGKYRGKCKITGEWVYGGLITYDPPNKKEACISKWVKDEKYGYLQETHFVDPETVGQYDGVHAYEGDILELYGKRYVLCFGNDPGNGILSFYLESDSETYKYCLYKMHNVIGNIHDKEKPSDN